MIDSDGFSLLRNASYRQRADITTARGTFRRVDDTTLMSIVVSTPVGTQLTRFVFASGALLIAVFLVATFIASLLEQSDVNPGVLVLATFFLRVSVISFLIMQGEEEFLITFIRNALDAVQVEDDRCLSIKY